MKLLPDGHVEAKSVEEIKRCPWFWSTRQEKWCYRPQWLRPMWNDELQRLIAMDPAYQ